jgi:nitrogen fixation/metabolism regulation signal transduction histidine kinase
MNDPKTSSQVCDQISTDGSNPPTTARPRMMRRQYVIDRRRQYRSAALTSGLSLTLLIIVNVAFSFLRDTQSVVLAAASPQLRPVLEAQDSRIGTMLIVVSIIFVAGVFAITIAETHRTAGAVYALQKALDRVRVGDFQTMLRLRPRDTLLDLRFPFNDMLNSLRNRSLAEANELDEFAAEISSGGMEASELAARLVDLAKRKRDFGPN